LDWQPRNMNAGFSVSSFCPPPFVEIRVGNLGSGMGRNATCCLTCNQFKALTAHNGGWGGIRTHEALAGLPVFKTGAFNRSATHPRRAIEHI
jgi:hypothetical protein